MAAPKRRGWRKIYLIYLGIGEETLETRAVEITGSHIGDAPVFPVLITQIPADDEIGNVTADGAQDTRKYRDAIVDPGAQVVIPPRRNAKPWGAASDGAIAPLCDLSEQMSVMRMFRQSNGFTPLKALYKPSCALREMDSFLPRA